MICWVEVVSPVRHTQLTARLNMLEVGRTFRKRKNLLNLHALYKNDRVADKKEMTVQSSGTYEIFHYST